MIKIKRTYGGSKPEVVVEPEHIVIQEAPEELAPEVNEPETQLEPAVDEVKVKKTRTKKI